jgi:hypothetical protein
MGPSVPLDNERTDTLYAFERFPVSGVRAQQEAATAAVDYGHVELPGPGAVHCAGPVTDATVTASRLTQPQTARPVPLHASCVTAVAEMFRPLPRSLYFRPPIVRTP